MKKAMLTIVSVLFFHGVVISQGGYVIVPEYFDDAYEEDLSTVTYLRFEALMENNSDTILTINWEVVNIDLPIEWGLSVSDKDMSYPPGPQITTSNGNPIAFSPGEVDIPFNVHIYPNEIVGCGTFDVLITIDGSGVVLDTIEYKLSINDMDCLLSGIDHHYIDEKIEILPNPFFDYLEINTESPINYVIIYDLMGAVQTTQSSNFSHLNVSNLAGGVYFAEVTLGSGQKVIRKVIKGE